MRPSRESKPITIVIKNLDPAPADFASNMLRVEKVVTGGGTIMMRIRPLDPGCYRFFDDSIRKQRAI